MTHISIEERDEMLDKYFNTTKNFHCATCQKSLFDDKINLFRYTCVKAQIRDIIINVQICKKCLPLIKFGMYCKSIGEEKCNHGLISTHNFIHEEI